MTSGPTYYSDEELVKRLRDLSRDHRQGGSRRRGGGIREIRSLASSLAARIYDEPEKWGIAEIDPRFRDDCAADTLIKLLSGQTDFTGRARVSDWFGRESEARFRQLWRMAEQAREKHKKLHEDDAWDEEEAAADGAAAEQPDAPEAAADGNGAADALDENSDIWRRFEAEFPSDAFVLRLRYVMNRSADEIAVMLDAPSVQAVGSRINRGRERFRMLCEQNGVSRRSIATIMSRMAEE